jgi:hypothetical protein
MKSYLNIALPLFPEGKNFKAQPCDGRGMLIFWDYRGIIYLERVITGRKMNSQDLREDPKEEEITHCIHREKKPH